MDARRDGARDPRARPRRRRPGGAAARPGLRDGRSGSCARATRAPARSAPASAPTDARALLRAWLASVELDLNEPELLALLQHEDFSHADLFRRARRCHERKLAKAVEQIATAAPGGADIAAAATTLFDACLAAIPYAPAAAFLGREKAKLAHRDGEPLRVALVADAVGGMHGVTHTLDELRERGVPGFEVEVVGTDRNVDRRLSAVAEVDIPFYAGLKVGVPSLPAIVEVARRRPLRPRPPLLARPVRRGRGDHRPDHGRAGARQLPHRARRLRRACARRTPSSSSPRGSRSRAFYGQCRRVLSPSPASDDVLREMGIADERIGRWDRGVDLGRFSPAAPRPRAAARRDHRPLRGPPHPREGRRPARRRVPRRHGSATPACTSRSPAAGPRRMRCAERLGEHATFLGWLEGDALAAAYASADIFLFASRTDTFGQVLLEAQASGLPVVAVGEGGPTSIVTDGVTGRLCPADAGDAGRRGRASSPPSRCSASASRAARWTPCAGARGSARCSASPTATAARWTAAAPAAAERATSAVPREAAVLEARRRLDRGGDAGLRAVAAPRLRVADVALFYGERSGGIRTYIDAKAAWAPATGAIEHHVIVPGEARGRAQRTAHAPRAAVAAPGRMNGYRMPIGVGACAGEIAQTNQYRPPEPRALPPVLSGRCSCPARTPLGRRRGRAHAVARPAQARRRVASR